MESVKDRFLRYVKIDTQSEHHVDKIPSTDKQLDLINDSNQLAEVSDQPMSVSCTPSQEQDRTMERLLTEMEEQGRRLPKI